MEKIMCAHCSENFTPRNKIQSYCSKPECQRARKAAWQRMKMIKDQEYRDAHRMSCKKWSINNPEYWKRYRDRNPKMVERNRLLQAIRDVRKKKRRDRSNQKKENSKNHSQNLAKMDVRNSSKFMMDGEYYLVPNLAKMDVRKIKIIEIPSS